MLHIVIGSLVIHLVDIACLTESQKLAHLIYLEQLTWIPINAGEAPEDSMTPMIGVSRDVELDPDKDVHNYAHHCGNLCGTSCRQEECDGIRHVHHVALRGGYGPT